ncbi:MAG: c-type cytochrome domain-containing protein [Pirellulaceae bacterium]|nr:hypothetical protein [Planctomycetales bacterium]
MNGLILILAASLSAGDPLDFHEQIRPILQRHCVGCHNGDDAEAGLDVATWAGLLRGGKHGPAVTPGQAASSRMWLMVSGRRGPRMPPDGEEPLTEGEMQLISDWIDQGARGAGRDDSVDHTIAFPHIETAVQRKASISAIAISPDGKQIAVGRFQRVTVSRLMSDCGGAAGGAAGGDSGEVGLADADSLSIDFPGKVASVCFSPLNDDLVIAGGTPGVEGRVAVYSSQDGRKRYELPGHRDLVYSAAYSRDGRWLATGGYDRLLRIFAAENGSLHQTCDGHTGAIVDVDFAPQCQVVATASADSTVKLWSVQTGQRWDTLGQSQKEVLSVVFSQDGKWIAASSADNRVRVWRFTSTDRAAINPLVESRFADDSPLLRIRFTPTSDALIGINHKGSVKMMAVGAWTPRLIASGTGAVPTGLAIVDERVALVSDFDGELRRTGLPEISNRDESVETLSINLSDQASASDDPVTAMRQALRAGSEPENVRPIEAMRKALAETPETEPNDELSQAMVLSEPCRIAGMIGWQDDQGSQDREGENRKLDEDWYRFRAAAGEEMMIEVRATGESSRLDSLVEVRDREGNPVPRVRLQATRDTYFTFRGKDSLESGDFRLFAWEEMELDQYLYANGEVVKLWLYPRGPDSGFLVYPGAGNRWTYFGTTAITHALAEPAYVVRPLDEGEAPLANGLPVFSIDYRNDDDPQRQWGSDSRLMFRAPREDEYHLRVTDARGGGGKDFMYQLTLRKTMPTYSVSVTAPDKPIPRGAGREFSVTVDRNDGFDGPVEITIGGLPTGVHATSPLVIEAGQRQATGTIYADADATVLHPAFTPTAVARAWIGETIQQQEISGWKTLTIGERPELQILIEPMTVGTEATSVDLAFVDDSEDAVEAMPDAGPVAAENWTLTVRPGQTVNARVVVLRGSAEGRVEFGNEGAGRNLPFGTYVDNIGLNGLLVPENASQRTFFVTAAPITRPQTREFFLKANSDGGITSHPVTIVVE